MTTHDILYATVNITWKIKNCCVSYLTEFTVVWAVVHLPLNLERVAHLQMIRYAKNAEPGYDMESWVSVGWRKIISLEWHLSMSMKDQKELILCRRKTALTKNWRLEPNRQEGRGAHWSWGSWHHPDTVGHVMCLGFPQNQILLKVSAPIIYL